LLEELEEAMLAAAQAGASAEDLGKGYGRLWAGCQERGACGWAKRQLIDSVQPALRSVAYWALVPCSGDDVEALFNAPTVPARPLIERRFRAVEPPQHSAALEQAASVVIRTGTTENARRAALVLGSVKHARSASVLLELLSETTDRDRSIAIGLALAKQSDPRAQAAFRWACKQAPSNLLCIPNIPGATISDASDEAATGPAELRRCVENRENTDRERYICFEQLARLKRSLAADIARTRSSEDLTKSPDPWMGELAATLVRFPNTEHLRRRLVALGLLDEASRFDPHHLTARSHLHAGGRVVGFNAHQHPVRYDFQLRRMAAWAGSPLADVVFDQEQNTTADDPHSYQARAYADGHRWSVRPAPGTCHDMGAIVRLLNSVLRHFDQPERFIPLDTNDEMLWAVYGPESALVDLIDEGLLRPGSGRHLHDEEPGAH
jgi:hypothetical protein